MNETIKLNGVPIDEERMVNAETVAPVLGMSSGQIRRLAIAGEIPAYKIGKVWRFRPSEIAAWLEEQKNINTDHNATEAKK